MIVNDPVLKELLPKGKTKKDKFRVEVFNDFFLCLVSREASLLGRREVLTGKAKFGILGDGKEVPQVAMARAFKKGDHRSGYYRDQTFVMALGLCTVEDYFAQLYADAENDPFSSGRQMNSHFATAYIDKKGEWTDHKNRYNVSADISSTAGQMGRGLGLAMASRKYKEVKVLRSKNVFSNKGSEICFCTIGDASTSEGPFWETMNAASVMQVPLLTIVWDDGYGISVPIELQTVKSSISKALEGFQSNQDGKGLEIQTVKGWDYPALCIAFEALAHKVRTEHCPGLLHVQELTQPQGHSTSGSHERYKSKERLKWEQEMDCIVQMEKWIIANNLISEEDIQALKDQAKKHVREAKTRAYKAHNKKSLQIKSQLEACYNALPSKTNQILSIEKDLGRLIDPQFGEILQNARRLQIELLGFGQPSVQLNDLITEAFAKGKETYSTNLYSKGDKAAIQVAVIEPIYSDQSKVMNGYQILNTFFDIIMSQDNRVMAFGEDVGHIGGVNQGFSGLQSKYGTDRIFDAGIREWTIVGQAIGLAMRGLRPITEIQYLDYLIYGLAPLSDDMATLRYRTNGLQKVPAIIRTRGHRLEGIWHAGSPLGMMLNSLRGIYIAVPRNMVQAVGFYNTFLQSDDPAIIIECLNGYRLKEKVPDNIGEYTVPLGVPEILQEGSDVTLVTYGSCVRVAQQGIKIAERHGYSVELIDAQTLLPFDLEHKIVASLQKTNRLILMDEDVPGGATAYMLQKVLEEQEGYKYLDAQPVTITAKEHRPPYGSDGDYFTKPNPEDVFDSIYGLFSNN